MVHRGIEHLELHRIVRVTDDVPEVLQVDIRAMYLRDMRSRAANLAEDVEAASKLLQHSSKALTEKHYRTKPQTLRAVR